MMILGKTQLKKLPKAVQDTLRTKGEVIVMPSYIKLSMVKGRVQVADFSVSTIWEADNNIARIPVIGKVIV